MNNKTHVQDQRLAFCNDEDGVHWEFYPGNPVLQLPGESDFRDPAVFPWVSATGDIEWRMVVALSSAQTVQVCARVLCADWEISMV